MTILIRSSHPSALSWSIPDRIALGSLIVGLFSLIVGIGTLWIACLAYRKFLVKRAQEHQLDIILALLQSIHESKNSIEIHYQSAINIKGVNHYWMRTTQSYSIFEMLELSEFKKAKDLYFFMPLLPNSLNWSFFNEFHTNPLLPKNIAVALQKFSIRNKHDYVRSSVFRRDAVIIGNVQNPVPGAAIFYIVEFDRAMKTTAEFAKAVNELKRAIIKWLTDYGINDINLIE